LPKTVIVGGVIVEKEERLSERVRQRLIWRGRRKPFLEHEAWLAPR
jgi:hypothetical protein